MSKQNRKIETFERLFEYAAWYISRYSISLKKLTFQLTRKTENPEMIQQVLAKITPFMDDRREIESRVLSAISLGQPLQDLRTKLLTKSFQKSDIDAIFAEYEDQFSDFTCYENTISKRIKTLQDRRYGAVRIEGEMCREYPQFRSQIKSLISQSTLDQIDDPLEAFESDRAKLARDDHKGRKKLFEKLVRRGFRSEDVRRFLAIVEEES